MRILVTDDDAQLLRFLKTALEEELFVVDVAKDGEKGSFLARTNEYDLIVLDIALPKRTGIEVCREIRDAGKMIPIIMLTATTDMKTKVDLLTIGADDYITKPFSFEELLVRIKAVLRRSKKIESNVLVIDDLTMDKEKNEVTRGGKSINLTRKEFMLLEYFMENPARVLSRGMILEHVWDMSADPFSNTIETHIHNLRSKINTLGKKELIKTISGRGYRLEP